MIYTIGLMGGHMGKQGNAVFYNLTAMNYVTKAYTGHAVARCLRFRTP